MKTVEISKQLVDSIEYSLLICNSIKDSILRAKIKSGIDNLFSDYLGLWTEGNKKEGQKNFLIEKIIADIDFIVELLDTFQHLKIIDNNSPLLFSCIKKILILKLSVITLLKRESAASNKKSQFDRGLSETEKNIELSRESNRRKERIINDFKMNPNREKVFNFIKNFPNKRTKDIVYEFDAFSKRTVKRTLTDLLKAGLIQKKVENRASYYSISNKGGVSVVSK